MRVPTAMPEHIDCPDEFAALAHKVGIKHVQATWLQFSGHHRKQGSMRGDWLAEWQIWCGRELKFQAERARLRVDEKSVPAWPSWQPPPAWFTGRATPEQGIQALEAIASGQVWFPCGCTVPADGHGGPPVCPRHEAAVSVSAPQAQSEQTDDAGAFEETDNTYTNEVEDGSEEAFPGI